MEYDICRGLPFKMNINEHHQTEMKVTEEISTEGSIPTETDERNEAQIKEDRRWSDNGGAVRDWRCGSDQYLWTLIRSKYPYYFHIMSYNYGDIEFLW
jgi:hypothetical protein